MAQSYLKWSLQRTLLYWLIKSEVIQPINVARDELTDFVLCKSVNLETPSCICSLSHMIYF